MDSQVSLDTVGVGEERGCWVISHPTDICSDDLGARQSEQGSCTVTSHGKSRTLHTVLSC